MKKISYLLIAFLPLVFACSQSGSKQALVETSVEELLANPEKYVDQQVVVQGTVSHVCKHGGKRMFVFHTDPDQTIRITTGEKLPEFEVALEGTEVRIEGLFKELRMNEAYVAGLEKETESELSESTDSLGTEESEHVHVGGSTAQYADLRDQIKNSEKGYISDFWIEQIKVEPVKPE